MRVLVGCEESQAVCIAFRELGHEAYSCDELDCSGGHPEWHIKADVLTVVSGGWLTLQNGDRVFIDDWDLGIFFPPCTHIAQAGGAWFERKRANGQQKEALIFFTKIANCKIEKKAIENPNGIFSSPTYIPKWFPELLPEMRKCGLPRKPDQTIEPYYFGDPKKKMTNLWLYGLPKLTWSPADNLFEQKTSVKPDGYYRIITRKGPYRTGSKRYLTWLDALPKKDRAKIKSKTFPGIAKAMATQWGKASEEKLSA
jgi:hypothetical protein